MELKFLDPTKKDNRFKCSMTALFYSLLNMVLYLVGSLIFPVDNIIAPEYLNMNSWVYFLLFFPTFSFHHRSRYYVAWYLVEGCSILGGVGFTGYNDKGEAEWKDANNCSALSFEIPKSIRDSSKAWNKRTQIWLDNYVYTRTNRSMIAVYITSACWHGVYSGYFAFFITIAVCQSIERIKYNKIFKRIQDKPNFVKMYDFIAAIMTLSMTNYVSVPFAVYFLYIIVINNRQITCSMEKITFWWTYCI